MPNVFPPTQRSREQACIQVLYPWHKTAESVLTMGESWCSQPVSISVVLQVLGCEMQDLVPQLLCCWPGTEDNVAQHLMNMCGTSRCTMLKNSESFTCPRLWMCWAKYGSDVWGVRHLPLALALGRSIRIPPQFPLTFLKKTMSKITKTYVNQGFQNRQHLTSISF